MIRLYLDEDSSDTDLLKALRLRRVDVIVPAEAAMLGKSDAEQLTWATVEDRVLYSANRGDFYNIHSEWMRQQRTHAGIVLGAQQRYSVGEQMRRLSFDTVLPSHRLWSLVLGPWSYLRRTDLCP